MVLLWLIPCVIVSVWLIINMGPHFWTRRSRGGSSQNGVVVFVESIRWLGVPWGMRSVGQGLQHAGFKGRFLYWRWHATWRGWFVLPAIMDTALLEREARRLASFLERLKRRQPNRPVYIIGYSCGAYLTLRALELLPADVYIDSVATLAGAFSPRRDLAPACNHINRQLIVCSGILDITIAGLGTLIFGTADRKHTFSAGIVGTRYEHPSIKQIRWRPGMIRFGFLGGHFSASCAGFVRELLADALGITSGNTLNDSPNINICSGTLDN